MRLPVVRKIALVGVVAADLAQVLPDFPEFGAH
jgi:hypothetical protein